MNLIYKLIENGYEIYQEGQEYPWIGQGGQYGDYIPYPVRVNGVLDYAQSAQAHIEAVIQEMQQAEEQARKAQSQLDRIEQGTNRLLEDIEQRAIDAYTLQLLDMGVI